MATANLPADFVARYARPPSDTTVARAISIHQSVRELLGDSDYATVLQGSYKNDTALWDMNDVDVVAVARNLVSTHFTGTTPANGVPWTDIFGRIEQRLQSDARYQGKWSREDKCIRLNAGINIDIVPAVRIGDATADPIAIYSFRAGGERKNWPRGHFDVAAAKSGRTAGNFKQAVRLLKRWSRYWFGSRKVAPSYYLECLVHSHADAIFTGDLPATFLSIAANVATLRYAQASLPRLVGEGNLLSPQEWSSAAFAEFQETLVRAASSARLAVSAPSEAQARAHWVTAFNGQQPS